jgi:hypothetical protein
MVIGYFFDFIISLFFAISFALYEPIWTASPTKYRGLLTKGCEVFFDCAVYFALSIQISCMVVLVRKDFGISATGFGGLTVQITWAVALLCMLPLLCPMLLLEYTHKKGSNYRLFLFCGCWLLFCYAFMSQMIGDYGPGQIGPDAGLGQPNAATNEEWNKLNSVCLAGVSYLSPREQKVLEGFGAAGSSLVIACGLTCLIWFIVKRQGPKRAQDFQEKVLPLLREERRARYLVWCLIAIILTLSIPQLRGILRIRGIQQELSNVTSSVYTDNQWSFGQVVAVMLFAPVFIEVGYLWVQERGEYQTGEYQPLPIRGGSLTPLKGAP